MAVQSSLHQDYNSNKQNIERSSEDAAAGDLGGNENGLAESGNSIDAREFLKDMRRKAQENLLELPPHSGSDERDVEYMVKIVHALIKINQEIWESCEDRMAPLYPPEFMLETAGRVNARMMRYSYDEAIVSASVEKVAITVKTSLHYKDFGPPPSIPSSLKELIVLRPLQKRNDLQILPDYLEYLGRAVLLDDDVLVSFLQKFQTHLEEIQCYVGEIEKWLAEQDLIVDFLNDLFDKELCLDSIGDEWGESSDEGDAICFNCFYPLSVHEGTSQRYFCSSLECTCLPKYSRSRRPKFYIPPAPDVLFTASMSPGIMGLTFDLSTEDGRLKLKVFHTFMEMFKTDEKDEVKEDICTVDSHYDPTPIIPIHSDSDSNSDSNSNSNSGDAWDSDSY